MLSISFVREHLEKVSERLQSRGFHFDSAHFRQLDEGRKQADMKSQALQAERNKASKQIGQLVGQGLSVVEAKAQVATVLETLDQQLDEQVKEARSWQEQLQNVLLTIPNLPDADVPLGSDEHGNMEVSRWGEPRAFNFKPKDHVALGEPLGLGFTQAAKISGARFALMRGDIARLHRALAQWMLNVHTQEHGYEEVSIPLIVNQEALKGTGQLPKFEEDLFRLEDERAFYLIPTAEVPLTNLVREMILDADALPMRWVSHSACFRSEAGSAGKDTRGLIRNHQFEKVELVQVVRAEDSAHALEALAGHAERILQKLELPYRKMLLCTGDMGFAAAKTYDLEVWLPAQDTYREISSCSNCRDYQARRMLARVRHSETGKPTLVHTLNGSGLAVGRTLVAVLENYQQKNGRVLVPQVLIPYLGGQTVLSEGL